jgi:hypothetical protein
MARAFCVVGITLETGGADFQITAVEVPSGSRRGSGRSIAQTGMRMTERSTRTLLPQEVLDERC